MNIKNLQVIHLVRRWGPVGGMENYVWNICNELDALGVKVSIICEENHSKFNEKIKVVELGKPFYKPRWLAYLLFSIKAYSQIKKYPKAIIHSHERCLQHDITTFHTEPFFHVKKKSLKWAFSPRMHAYLYMEKRELGYYQRKPVTVIPVSLKIKQKLLDYYPEINASVKDPITPGVNSLTPNLSPSVPSTGGTLGFIGKEWQRKGLIKFIQISEKLLLSRPDLKLIILGPDKQEIQAICKNFSGQISFKGWQSASQFYQHIDVLVHPASSEAYGMVIAEAMSCRVPVVISDLCGASSDVSPENGSILSLEDSAVKWASTVDSWLINKNSTQGYKRTWSSVAHDYLNHYLQIDAVKKNI